MRPAFRWTVALVLGQLLSFLFFQDEPLGARAAIGLFTGIFLGLVSSKEQRDQSRSFDAVRRGDRAECLALLQKQRPGGIFGKMVS